MSTTDKLAEALRLAREWFRHEEAGEGPQADDVIKAADEAIAAHDAEQAQEAQQAAGQEQDERAAFDVWFLGFRHGWKSEKEVASDAWRAALAQRREPLTEKHHGIGATTGEQR